MTQEEKDILIADLCGRLPYGLIIKCNDGFRQSKEKLVSIDVGNGLINYDWLLTNIKPYLRPLSSMTEEEFTKLKEYSGLIYDQLDLTSFQNGVYKCLDFYLNEVPSGAVIRVFDWLNKYHFDYRDLIQMGLALEAKEGMYNN